MTIILEDNFNDGNYDGWTVDNGTWNATNNYLESSSTTNPQGIRIGITAELSGVSLSFTGRVYVQAGTAIYPYFLATQTNMGGGDADGYRLTLSPVVNNIFERMDNGGATTLIDSGGTLSADTWTTFEINRDSAGEWSMKIAGGDVGTPTTDTTYESFTNKYFVVANGGSTNPNRIDDILMQAPVAAPAPAAVAYMRPTKYW